MDFKYQSPADRILVATLIAAGWSKARIVELSPDELAGQVALLSQDQATIAKWAAEGLPAASGPSLAQSTPAKPEDELERLREAYPCPTAGFIAEIEAAHAREGTDPHTGHRIGSAKAKGS